MKKHVYFIQQGEDGPIRIGIADNVRSRLDDIQTSHHETLRVVGWISKGGRDMEQDLHRRFAAHRIGREWFRPDPELLGFLATDPLIRPPDRLGRPGRPHLPARVGGRPNQPRSFADVIALCHQILRWDGEGIGMGYTIDKITQHLRCNNKTALSWIGRARSIEGLMHTPDCL